MAKTEATMKNDGGADGRIFRIGRSIRSSAALAEVLMLLAF